jgi:hypothetical protein
MEAAASMRRDPRSAAITRMTGVNSMYRQKKDLSSISETTSSYSNIAKNGLKSGASILSNNYCGIISEKS